jgi:hypothetical protein
MDTRDTNGHEPNGPNTALLFIERQRVRQVIWRIA